MYVSSAKKKKEVREWGAYRLMINRIAGFAISTDSVLVVQIPVVEN